MAQMPGIEQTATVEVGNYRSCCADCDSRYFGDNTCGGCGQELKYAVNVGSQPDRFAQMYAKENGLQFVPRR